MRFSKKGAFHVKKSIRASSLKKHFTRYLLRNMNLIWVYQLFFVTVSFKLKKCSEKIQTHIYWKLINYRDISLLQHCPTPWLLTPCVQWYHCITSRVMLHRPRKRHSTHHCKGGLWENSSVYLDLPVSYIRLIVYWLSFKGNRQDFVGTLSVCPMIPMNQLQSPRVTMTQETSHYPPS